MVENRGGVMPKSELSRELEDALRKRLRENLDTSIVKFPKKRKQYVLLVQTEKGKVPVGHVDAGFEFGSKVVLCEVEIAGFPAATLVRTLCFAHHLKEPKEIYLFHFFAPTPYFEEWAGGWRITTEFVTKLLENKVHYYKCHLTGPRLAKVLRDIPKDEIGGIVRQYVEQIINKIKSGDKDGSIGIPWKLNK